ncbi:MAG: hypothetical protein NUW37_03620 [Planctomycetes bacterium]|nr:hypothetical protein [Planctomycetota bacterium]
MREDIRDVILGGSKKATLQELSKKGFNKVRVIDEDKIFALIKEAVDAAIGQQGGDLLDLERDAPAVDAEKVQGAAREAFAKRLTDHQQAIKVQDNILKLRQLFQRLIDDVDQALGKNDIKSGREGLSVIGDQVGSLLEKIMEKDELARKSAIKMADLEKKLENVAKGKGGLEDYENFDFSVLGTKEGKMMVRNLLSELSRTKKENASLADDVKSGDDSRAQLVKDLATEKQNAIRLRTEIQLLRERSEDAHHLRDSKTLLDAFNRLEASFEELQDRHLRLDLLVEDLIQENYNLAMGGGKVKSFDPEIANTIVVEI